MTEGFNIISTPQLMWLKSPVFQGLGCLWCSEGPGVAMSEGDFSHAQGGDPGRRTRRSVFWLRGHRDEVVPVRRYSRMYLVYFYKSNLNLHQASSLDGLIEVLFCALLQLPLLDIAEPCWVAGNSCETLILSLSDCYASHPLTSWHH